MKKIILYLATVTIGLSLSAQRKKKTADDDCTNPVIEKSSRITSYRYEYDFSHFRTDNICNIIPKHQKSKIYVRINNINRMLYQITSTGVLESLPLEKISIFDSLASSMKGEKINPSLGDSVSNPETQVQTFSVGKKTLTLQANPFFKQQSEIKKRLDLIKCDFSAWVANMYKIESLLNFAKNIPVIIAGEKYSQANLKLKILNDPNLLEFDRSIITAPAMPNISADFPRLQASVVIQPSSLTREIKAVYEKMKKAKAEIEALIAEIKTICRANILKLTDEDCNTDQFIRGLPPDFDKAIEQAKKIDANKVVEAAGEVTILLNKVNDPGNFYYQLNTPFDIEGDWYNAKITFTPKSEYAKYIQPDSLVYRFPVRGKFEWAIGTALNFQVTTSLLDESFQIDSARTADGLIKKDTFAIKRNSNRNTMIPSIGMMAHFYWQQHSAITPGIVLGLSTSSVELKDLRAYLGGSILIGNITDKIFLNTGLAFGWTDRLKANLEIGENPKSQIPFNGDNIGSSEQLVERAFKVGWFFGFTYRLSK